MNNQVMDMARALAQTVAQSEEYADMRLAQSAAEADIELTAAFDAYSAKRKEIEDLTAQKDIDYDKMAALTRELDEMQENLQKIPLMAQLQQAKGAFSDMMRQVNLTLQQVLAPEEASCGGDCEACHSHCHH